MDYSPATGVGGTGRVRMSVPVQNSCTETLMIISSRNSPTWVGLAQPIKDPNTTKRSLPATVYLFSLLDSAHFTFCRSRLNVIIKQIASTRQGHGVSRCWLKHYLGRFSGGAERHPLHPLEDRTILIPLPMNSFVTM